MQVALKATDIGHLAAPLPVHKRWTSQLTEEFFCQGDRKPFARIETCTLRYQGVEGLVHASRGLHCGVQPVKAYLSTIVKESGNLMDSRSGSAIEQCCQK